MCSTRGHGVSSPDLLKHIAAGTHGLSQGAPMPPKQLVAPCLHTGCSGQTSHCSSTVKRVCVGRRNEHLPACSPGQGQGHGRALGVRLGSSDGNTPARRAFLLLPSPAVRSPAHLLRLPPIPQQCPPACLVFSSPANYPNQLPMKYLNQI